MQPIYLPEGRMAFHAVGGVCRCLMCWRTSKEPTVAGAEGARGRVIGNNRGGGNGSGADFLQLLLNRIHGRDFSRGYNML